MSEKRGVLGGVFLILGAVPLLLTYGASPIGYAAALLVLIGAVVSYGSYRAETVP